LRRLRYLEEVVIDCEQAEVSGEAVKELFWMVRKLRMLGKVVIWVRFDQTGMAREWWERIVECCCRRWIHFKCLRVE